MQSLPPNNSSIPSQPVMSSQPRHYALVHPMTCGLINLGSTCYMNAILQCLAHCPPFLRDLSKENAQRIRLGTDEKDFFHSFYRLIVDMHTLKTSVDPSEFFRSFVMKTFGTHEDNDMSEFLQFVLDKIHECCKKEKMTTMSDVDNSSNNMMIFSNAVGADEAAAAAAALRKHFADDFSFIRKLFIGQYIVSVKTQCGNVSNTFDPFSVLTLPVPDKTCCDLQECFQLWMQPEILENWREEASGHCGQSGRRRMHAEIHTGIWNISQILIIHLNRFIGTSKNFCQIKFPATLNFANLTNSRSTVNYSLIAVANHIGSTSAGHCYTDCKRINDGKWLRYDDGNVHDVQQFHLSHAYILFYCASGSDVR